MGYSNEVEGNNQMYSEYAKFKFEGNFFSSVGNSNKYR